MAGEPTMTVVGNLAGEPNLRYSPQGKAVIEFSVAQTPRTKDRQSDQWVDGTTQWYRVVAFGRDAENLSESLPWPEAKGTRVIALGRLSIDEWEDKQGQKRTTMKLMADEVGLSAKWATVTATKAQRTAAAPAPATRDDDPWASSGTVSDDEPPF